MHAYQYLFATHASTVACPSCGDAAEVIDRFALGTSEGPALHLKVRCEHGHWYTLPADRVVAHTADDATMAAWSAMSRSTSA
jgi:hypothetical protein